MALTLRTRLVLLAGLMALASSAAAQDWTQWRGPNRDGVVPSFREPATWPDALTKHWELDVGLGYASPILVGDRLYLHTRQGEDEIVQALDAASGDLLWRQSYPAPFEMNPFTARHGAGPKSTPTFADGRLFTFGKSGIVTAFEAETGRLLWQTTAPPVQPLYHAAMSPLVDGDLVILHVGGDDDGALTAFDVATGDVRWSWDGDGPAYGSPMVFELAGTRQVVSYTRESLVGLSAASGELLWRRPGRKENILTQTPILYGDTVIEAMNAEGITAFRVSRDGDGWRTKDVWHTDEVSLFWPTASPSTMCSSGCRN